jgi:hypothetical protein
VPKGDVEWETSKDTFLKKHPFEAPFFTFDVLRLMCDTQTHILRKRSG